MIRKHSTSCEVVQREELRESDRREMLALFSSYFHLEHPSFFHTHLEEKDLVFLLRDREGVIRGFSTLALWRRHHRERELLVLYSGDTIIHREYWGGTALASTWIRTTLSLVERHNLESYWLLLSGGFRTYRYLPLFCQEFHPSPHAPFPPHLRELRDWLASSHFRENYDPATGIVRFSSGATPLKKGVSEVDEGRLRNPHISFFARANPGHASGDELVCLAPLHRRNLTGAARRVLEQESQHGPGR